MCEVLHIWCLVMHRQNSTACMGCLLTQGCLLYWLLKWTKLISQFAWAPILRGGCPVLGTWMPIGIQDACFGGCTYSLDTGLVYSRKVIQAQGKMHIRKGYCLFLTIFVNRFQWISVVINIPGPLELGVTLTEFFGRELAFDGENFFCMCFCSSTLIFLYQCVYNNQK